jgi:primosomal protein N'
MKDTEIHHYIDSIFSPSDIGQYLIPWSVFIFPDDILLSIFQESQKDHGDIGVFPIDLTPAKRVKSWIDTYEAKYTIIFWTRRILYYNLSVYDHIFYIEDAFATEQYSYPTKIQNLDILKSLERGGRHNIKIISSTPSLQTLAYFQNGKIKTIRK